jgi:hypothetical protein
VNGKLDGLMQTVSQDSVRLQDVQQRLHRIEHLQDSGRERALNETQDFAGK